MTGALRLLAVWVAIAAASAHTIGQANAQEHRMQLNTVKFTLRPLALASAAATAGLKLVDAAAGVQLITSATTAPPAGAASTVFSMMPLRPTEGAAKPFRTLTHLLPAPPAWDLVLDGKAQRLALVHEKALGGSSVLLLSGFDKADAGLPAGYDAASYTLPRFVGKRSDAATQRITAIADSERAVWFERARSGGYERKGTLCDCVDALVVPYRGAFGLVYKTRVPGAVRGNLTWPGTLHWQPLDTQLAPTGTAQTLFDGYTVFEFAVDTAGDAIAMLLTTAQGTRLALAASPSGPWAGHAFTEPAQGEALSQPSLVLTPELVHMALLDQAGSAQARVLFGTASVVLPGR